MFNTKVLASMDIVETPMSEKAFEITRSAMGALGDFGENVIKNPDLLYMQGIFVSSGKNSNGDFFLPSEMLKSFVTADLKPIDVEHEIEEVTSYVKTRSINLAPLSRQENKNTIVGVMYDVAFVEESSGKKLLSSDMRQILSSDNPMIPFDMDEIDRKCLEGEDKYHIIVAAVLWKFLFPKTVADLAFDINYKDRAISMECLFKKYDYFSEGKIIPVENNMGSMPSGYGRVLRDIIWSGGGLVSNPANPDAFDFIKIIANKSCACLVQTEDKKMNEELKQLATANAELVKQVAKLTEENNSERAKAADLQGRFNGLEAANASLKNAEKSLEEKNNSSEASLKSVTEQLEASKASLEALTKELATAKEQVEKLAATAAENEALKTDLEASKAEVKKFADIALAADRKSKLEEANVLLEKDTAEALVSYSEEAFASMLEDRAEIAKASASKGTVVPSFLGNLTDSKKAMSGLSTATASKSETPGSRVVSLESLFAQI